MGWNLGRAVTTIVTLAIVGRPLLRILRRTNRRATFAPG
jgi:energy-coupling factor transport system substrate-specific component